MSGSAAEVGLYDGDLADFASLDGWRDFLRGIPDAIARAAEHGMPIRVELPAEPEPHQAALLTTLGVEWTVTRVTAQAQNVRQLGDMDPTIHKHTGRSSTGKKVEELREAEDAWRDAQPTLTRCALDGCAWTFEGSAVDGRAASLEHREAAHPGAGGKRRRSKEGDLAAIHRFRQKASAAEERAEAMKTVEQRKAARAAGRPEPQTGPAIQSVLEPAASAGGEASGARKQPERGASTTRRSSAGELWPRDRIIAAVVAWAERTGYAPQQLDWSGPTTDEHPNKQLVKRVFGTWGAAVEAAGFPRPRRGSARLPLSSRRGVGDLALTSSAPEPGEDAAADAAASGASLLVRPDETAHPERARAAAWQREEILTAIRRWHAQYGEPPTANAWARRLLGYPSTSTVAKHFGSWAAAIQAAGFPKPVQGGMISESEPAPERRIKVPGTGLAYRTPEEAYVAAEEIESDGDRVAVDARFDGNDAKADQAIDAARGLADRIRAAAAAAEERFAKLEPDARLDTGGPAAVSTPAPAPLLISADLRGALLETITACERLLQAWRQELAA